MCNEEFNKNESDENNKFRDHFHCTEVFRGTAHNMCNPKTCGPAVFHNGSNYDYHFIIKELTKEFREQFECLVENTEKHITTAIQKYNEYDLVTTYKMKLLIVYNSWLVLCQV